MALRTCVECADVFTLAENEMRWYAMRDLELPKRCKDCRNRRRERTAMVPERTAHAVHSATR